MADRLQLPPTALFWYTYHHVPELRDLVDHVCHPRDRSVEPV
jgi:hypothetical protein